MILQRLKRETAARHVALESRSLLLDPGLSQTTYIESLRRFFGYYEPLESQLIGSHLGHGSRIAYTDRHKTPQLVKDLLALGITPDALSKVPRCDALPDVSSAARLYGCLYVIEGATLGGQIITRHLRAQLGVTAESGGAFFSGYGEKTGSRWKTFGAQLSAFALHSESDDEIVAAANETFETLDCWLYPTNQQGIRHHESASYR